MKRETEKKWYSINIEKDAFNISGRTDGSLTFLNIELPTVTLYGSRIIKGSKGTFIAPPSYKNGDKFFRHYYITKELSEQVLAALKEFDKTLVD